MKSFAIVGKNISYSKSPYIHNIFFNQLNLKYKYFIKNYKDNFLNNVSKLLNKNNIYGINITVPYKEESLYLCDILDINSYISKSVNTIEKISNNIYKGYNTDGIGIINDLKRINFINKNTKKILIIGYGGSSKGIIPELYKYNNNIYVTGKNYDNLNKLKINFNLFNINIKILDINNIYNYNFDLIINATSSSYKKEIPNIPKYLINNKTKCYDLFYDLNNDTEFLKWCKKNGSINCSDGIGMLIYQAANSFYIWNNIFPNLDNVFNKIIKK